MWVSWTMEIKVKNLNLGLAYMKKICLEQKGHPPTQASLKEATFHAFLYKTWRLANRLNYKKLARLEG